MHPYISLACHTNSASVNSTTESLLRGSTAEQSRAMSMFVYIQANILHKSAVLQIGINRSLHTVKLLINVPKPQTPWHLLEAWRLTTSLEF